MRDSIVFARMCDEPVQALRQSGSRVYYYRRFHERHNEFGSEKFCPFKNVRYVADTQEEALAFYKFVLDREDAQRLAEREFKDKWDAQAESKFGVVVPGRTARRSAPPISKIIKEKRK